MYYNTIKIPDNIQLSIQNNNIIYIKGPLGETNIKGIANIKLVENNQLIIYNKKKSLQGLNISLIKKKIKGVYQGYKLNLYLKGIGFKVSFENDKLIFKLGYSHDILLYVPNQIKIVVNKSNTIISLFGIDYNILTQFAAKIKHLRPIEPYKGKGIFFRNETFLRKEGKKK